MEEKINFKKDKKSTPDTSVPSSIGCEPGLGTNSTAVKQLVCWITTGGQKRQNTVIYIHAYIHQPNKCGMAMRGNVSDVARTHVACSRLAGRAARAAQPRRRAQPPRRSCPRARDTCQRAQAACQLAAQGPPEAQAWAAPTGRAFEGTVLVACRIAGNGPTTEEKEKKKKNGEQSFFKKK
jgi:hypothetical protein